MQTHLKGFKVSKTPTFLAHLAFASGAMWKYNQDPTALPSYLTLTLEPYQIKEQHYAVIRQAETVWIKLLIKMSQDLSLIQSFHYDQKDDFMIGNMLNIARKTYQNKNKIMNMIILRSDYMFNEAKQVFQQTQFNAMAVGFWVLSESVQDFHKAIQTLKQNPLTIYEQPSKLKVISAFKQVHQIYEKEYKTKAGVLIVAEGVDSDIIEQAQIEKQLLLSGIEVIKLPFSKLITKLQFDTETRRATVDGLQIAIAYYRQGYNPHHYDVEGSWLVREKLEVSRAVCVPNVFIQLLNFKNVQTKLKTTDVMKNYLSNEEVQLLLKVQTTIFTTEEVKNNKEQLIKQYGNNLVVKSIHEGSQQNYFYQKAIQKIRELPAESFLAMQYIKPNNRRVQVLTQDNTIIEYDAISELGVYGVGLYKDGENIQRNECLGYLIRTFEDGKGQVGLQYGRKGVDALAFI